MRLLIDANVFLEVFLNQEQAETARSLLSMVAEHEMFLSDFTLHTIGVVLFRRQLYKTFREFVQDTIGRAGFSVLYLSAVDCLLHAPPAKPVPATVTVCRLLSLMVKVCRIDSL